MGNNVKIKYVNHSMNLDQPSVFLFTKNEIPTFDALRDGVAWRVIDKVGRGSSCTFNFPVLTQINAFWRGRTCQTATMPAQIGSKFCITKDETGIVLLGDGNAGNTRSIDVASKIHVPNGISVDRYKDGKLMMRKNIVAYDQKATLVLHPKLYWGLASEIQEGELLSSAVLNFDSFFEQDLEGLSEVTVALHGNAQDVYQFVIESQR